MRFTSIPQALAAISFFYHLAGADEVVQMVYETQIVTVTAGVAGQRDWESFRHWSTPTTAFESAPETTPEIISLTTTSTIPTTSSTTSSTTTTSAKASTTLSTTTSTSVQVSVANFPSPTSSASALSAAILNSTNTYRTEFAAAPVVWNDTLADAAQTWASRCYFAHSGGAYGENIAAAWPTLNAIDGVDMWGDEESSYDWLAATFTETTGHFTQLVWQSTTDVGCALVSCQNTDTSNGGIDNGDFLVCEYYPAGNVIGYFAENVKKVVSKRGLIGLAGRSEMGRMFG